MLIHPNFDPVAFSIGPFVVRWYGLMYLGGFVLGWWLGRLRTHVYPQWRFADVDDMVFYIAFGVVLGGRIGYIVFYQFAAWLEDPLLIFKIWQGGMSFHGGLLGVMVAVWLLSRKINKSFFELMDFIAPLIPPGLLLGRIGNFINGELWGRVSDVPWAMVFAAADDLPRHPSQLYQAFAEGIVLFTIVWLYSAKPRPTMAVSAVFLVVYGVLRCFTELFREPDAHLGFIAFEWLTMGQLLSIPMIIIGLVLLRQAYAKKTKDGCDSFPSNH